MPDLTPEQLAAKLAAEEKAAKAQAKAEAEAAAAAEVARLKEEERLNSPVLIDHKAQRLLVFHHPQSGAMVTRIMGANEVLTAEQAAQEAELQKPVHIIPGLHPYPTRVWESMQNHPHIKNLVKDGVLVIQTKASLGQKLKEGEDAKAPAKALPKSLENVEVSTARDLAAGVQDASLLASWLEDETLRGKRQTVLDALQDNLKRVRENDAKFDAARGGK